jgi:hypothetical protein
VALGNIFGAGSNPALSTSRRGEMEHTIALEGVGMSVRLRPARIAEDRTTRRVTHNFDLRSCKCYKQPGEVPPAGNFFEVVTMDYIPGPTGCMNEDGTWTSYMQPSAHQKAEILKAELLNLTKRVAELEKRQREISR